MNLTDYSIQKKIQGGDIKEYERVFTTYYVPLCRYACKFLKDMDMAEDIVQEFFYNFWKNRAAFSPKLSLNAYFYQSIQNNSLHYIEHLQVQKHYADAVVSESNGKVPFEELPDMGLKELNTAIESTLNRLPDRCSRIFRMNRFEGKKYREIADILSISVKTVEADMGKALQAFREVLKDFKNVPS